MARGNGRANVSRDKKTKKPETENNDDQVKCGSCMKFLWEKDEADDSGQDQSKNLECEVCLRWFHAVCIDDGVAMYNIMTKQKSIHWFCPQCDHAAAEIHKKVTFLQGEYAQLRQDLTALSTKITKNENAIKAAQNNCEAIVTDKFNLEKAAMKSEIKQEIETELNDIIKQKLQELNLNPELDDPEQEEDADDDNTNAWNDVNRRRNHLRQHMPTPNLRNIINQEMHEQKQIADIKLNLVMSGIPETGSEEQDRNKAIEIICAELDIEAEIEKVVRCGKKIPEDPTKPRKLKLFMRSQANRKQILQNASKLRESVNEDTKAKVFINADQTKKQQLESKNLQDQLKTKRLEEPGKTFKIRKGEIIEIE